MNLLKLTKIDTHEKDDALYATSNYMKMRCIFNDMPLYMEERNFPIDIRSNDNSNFDK